MPPKDTQSPMNMTTSSPQKQKNSSGFRPSAAALPTGEHGPTVANNEIIIAVMGVTGSGKSSFIKTVTGHSDVEVSDGLNSCTTKVAPYTFQHHGATITLVDTPGFSDTDRSDVGILKEISDWASETYSKGQLLSGILYLHRISDNRMDGSAIRSLRLLKSLVGEDSLKNVLLTTTHWSRVVREAGEMREQELRETENFWKGLLDHGATLTRYEGDRQSGLELLRRIILSKLAILDIQNEIIVEGKELLDTSAGKSVQEDLKKMQEVYETEIKKISKELQEAIDAKDDEAKVAWEEEWREKVAKFEEIKVERRNFAKIKSPAKGLLSRNELGLLPDKEALLIYVKGTMEVGNVGLSGSLLSSMLDSNAQLRSKIAIQGVYYNPFMSVLTLLAGGSRQGSQGVLKAVREGIKCSPNARIILCGFSQGAMIIRRALSKLKDPEHTRINGVIFFGDPARLGPRLPRPFEDRLLNLRLPGDFVHLKIPAPTTIHYWYGVTFPTAIEFIQQKIEER